MGISDADSNTGQAITYQKVLKRGKPHVGAMFYDGIAAAVHIHITVPTVVHSQLPAGNDEDAVCQLRDMRRAVDRSCYYDTVVYILSRQTPGWDRAFKDTTAAIGQHNPIAGMN